MKLYDNIIKQTLDALGTPDRVYAYDPACAWRDRGESELVMQRDAALELGGSGRKSVNFTCVTSTPELVTNDEIWLYGSEIAQLRGDVPFARIALLEVDDLGGDTKIAVQMSTVADFYVSDDLKKEPSRYTKYVQAAEDLKNDKVDCIVMDELPAKEMVKGNDTLEILDGEVFTDKYAFAFKKGNTELEEKVNKVLQKLIDDGKVDEFTLNHTK